MFLPKTLPSFSQMQKKLKTSRNLNLRDFRTSTLGDYMHLTFISKQLEPEKKNVFDWHRLLIIQVKHSYISKSDCVLFQ